VRNNLIKKPKRGPKVGITFFDWVKLVDDGRSILVHNKETFRQLTLLPLYLVDQLVENPARVLYNYRTTDADTGKVTTLNRDSPARELMECIIRTSCT